MNGLSSITDVVTALDVIVRDCSLRQHRAGYFAALYKRMTTAVGEGVRNGRFEDGPRMVQLDLVFAQRYLSAYTAFAKSEGCTQSWQCVFSACTNRSPIVLQHLLLGINTHINLDLAMAAATVAPGEKIHALQTDFNRINDLIAALMDDVQQCLEEVWWPMRFLQNVVNRQGRPVLNFSIGLAREVAWRNALKLAALSPEGQARYLAEMDSAVRTVGDRILHPGMWPAFLLRLVRLTEFDDVRRTIHLIDTTVVEEPVKTST